MADIKQIARDMVEQVYGAGKLELFDQFCADGYRYHDPIAGDLDANAEKQFVRDLRAAFPDLKMRTEMCFAEGDKTCIAWHCTGTQRGTFMGAPPSGRRIELRGIDIARFEGDKMKEVWTQIDTLGLMQQLGFVPPIAKAAAPSPQARA